MDDVTLGTLAHGMPHVGGDPLTAAGGTLAPSLTGEQRQGGQSTLVTLPAAEAGLETLSLYPGLPAGRRQQRTEAVLALARGQSHHFVEKRDVMCTYETCPGGSKKRERKRDYRERLRTHLLVLLTLMTCSCLAKISVSCLIIHENKESVLPEFVIVCLCLEKQ